MSIPMNTPTSTPGAGRGNSAAAALDLLAAAGNALSPGHTPDAPTGPATGAGFLALVQHALGVENGEAVGCPLPEQDADAAPAVAEAAEADGTQPAPTFLDPIYAALVANFTPLPASLPGPMTAPENTPALEATEGVAAPGGIAANTASEFPEHTGIPSPETEAPAGSDGGEPAAAVALTPDTRSPAGPEGAGSAAPTQDIQAPAVPEGAGTAAPTQDIQAPAVPEGAGTAAPTQNIQPPQAVTTPGAPSAEPAANPITTQVVDRLTALTSRNGTHRITIDLTPGDLGQVRVVMTVRDGAVHVRLAAGEHDTRAALVEGSAELKALLGAAGATDTKVTVRELGNAFGTQTQQNQSQSQDQSQAQQHAQDHTAGGQGWTQDQRAGTRAGYDPATDGTTTSHRDSGAGATGNRSSETVTSTRPGGLDMTM